LTRYRGRFAPSPTGPLHQGSLVTALASYLDARSHGGEWLVRIEDIDIPRTVHGAADEILRCLEACALAWDSGIVYQTTRFDAYQSALDRLSQLGQTYACGCTRKDSVCTCQTVLPPGRTARSIRLRVPEGDSFPLFRADGIWSYQLAVVVDDAWQQITHVVRGADLLDSTPRQVLLQHLLGLDPVTYTHIPVVLAPDGQKLSKQTKAPAVDITRPGPALIAALRFLAQPVPDGLEHCPPCDIVAHAIRHWHLH
jgi:glutamyl-Q tRNA(Asp) synthetase